MDGCPDEKSLRDPTNAAHVASCGECREKLEVLRLLEAPESPDESRALDALAGEPLRVLAAAQLRAGRGAMRLRERPRWSVYVAALAASAAAVALAISRMPREPAATLRELQGEGRPLEVAMADLPYASYQPKRGARDEARFDAALRRLLEAREKRRPGAERALAMLYLLRGGPGDAARADQALASAGEGPEAELDRGVAQFARGDLAAALDHFDRAPGLPAARFDRALVLEKLGLRKRAAQAFAALAAEKTPWSAEAAVRARSLRDEPPPPTPSRRLEVMRALLAASDGGQLAQAMRDAQGMPDLLALAQKLDPRRLGEHAKLYKTYVSLRARAVSGAARDAEVRDFARLAAVQADPLLWSASLQLAGYVYAARGDWRAAQPYESSVAGACRVRGCPVEVEAIALDELADLAARDGDFPTARKLQDRAEALFTRVGAQAQLAELYGKRAALLDEEDRLVEASVAAQLAVQQLSRWAAPASLPSALEHAADIAERRGQHRAVKELGEEALEVARASGNRDVEVDAAARLAASAVALGNLPDARQRLEAEIGRLMDAGHATQAARLRAQLASVLLASKDAAGALAETERGLAAAEAGSFESSRVLLHTAHARALAALGRDGSAELSQALDELARAIAGSSDPAPLLEAGHDLVGELAAFASSADELALPLDRLRAAALGVAPAARGWSRALPAGACVLVLVTSGKGIWQGIATREGGGVRAVAADRLAAGTERCVELWLFAEESLAPPEQATFVATSITRLLAPEKAGAPRRALFVSAQTAGDVAAAAAALPGAEEEKAALQATGAEVAELSGERATPDLLLRLAADEPLLHFAVHGFGGAFLQLAGEGGRLAARDIARAHLLPQARIVLSACEAGAPGPRGVAWAFARAGAAVVAAPRGEIDDRAAARWSRRFYAALGRGQTFAQAAREARLDGARFVVVK